MKAPQKYFILVDDDNNFFSKEYKKRGASVKRIYKKTSIIAKIVRRLHMYSRLPGYSVWFDQWKNELSDQKAVIVFASVIKVPAVRFISKHYPGIRVVFWYWDSVMLCVNARKIQGANVEKWSFDPEDCKKYNMHFNTQFYFKNLVADSSDSKVESIDVLFIGADKGRQMELVRIQDEMKKLNISTYFHITASGQMNVFQKCGYQPYLPYERVLQYISKSKAILDITAKGQEGLTLRPLEALFYGKKLITNNSSIMQYDFYHPNNIFILRANNMNELVDFLELPLYQIDHSIIDQYDFEAWESRFFEAGV